MEGDKSPSIVSAPFQPQRTREVVSLDEDTYLNRLRLNLLKVFSRKNFGIHLQFFRMRSISFPQTITIFLFSGCLRMS